MNQSRIGPFLLSQRLGADAACTVHQAIHAEQRKAVALKLFAVPFGTGADRSAEFAHEWDTLKNLRHPNIVRCYGGGFEEMQAYLAYELVRGETLAALLDRRDKLAWEQVVEYGLQIAAGLEYAHAREVFHQNLMPDKLLIDELGQVQIADFRVDRSNQTLYHTPAQRTLAGVAYLAPEQLAVAPLVSAKSDLYALGCILFEMLSGRLPFAGETPEELVEHKLHKTAPRVATLVFDCPVWLDALVTQLLDPDPANRPHGAAAVRLALEQTKRRMTAGTSVAEHALSGLSPLKMPGDKSEARKLLGRKQQRPIDSRPLHERPLMVAAVLSTLALFAAAILAWAFWPLSELQLITKADVLMASEDPYQWESARQSYLEPLLKRFPDSEYAPRARAHLDTIQMDTAETRLRNRLRFRREFKNEGERLLAEAWQFEQFGDAAAALDKYMSLVDLLDDQTSADRPYVLLARRQIAKLKAGGEPAGERAEFVKKRLAKADELAAGGEEVEARKIWQSVVALYGNNPELKSLVEQAQARLAEK